MYRRKYSSLIKKTIFRSPGGDRRDAVCPDQRHFRDLELRRSLLQTLDRHRRHVEHGQHRKLAGNFS
jgi:hypothetical protein